MAQCVAGAEKRPIVGDKDVIDVDMQPSKRLKQVRLPFKPLDCKPLTPSPVANNSASKKRKSSGPDSPSSKAKLSKFPDLRSSAEKLKPTKVNNDNEVSSSSEAEGLPASGNKSRNAANNILEKFVRREDEISSTNDVIDLTGSANINENEENNPVKAKSPQKSKAKLPAETNTKENLCTPAEANLMESESCSENTLKSPVPSGKSNSTKKSEDHFARKLVFGVEKTSDDCNTADVEATPKSLSPEEADTKSLEEDLAAENGAEGTDELQEDEEDTTQDEEDTTQDSETPNESMNLKSNSDDESPPSQKKEEGEWSSKTPVSKRRPLRTSTPQTCEPVNTSCSSVDGTTPSSESKPKRTLSKKQAERAALREKVKEEKERQKQEAKEQKEKERLEKKKKRDEEKAEKERAKNEEKEKKEQERLKKKEEAEKEKQEKLKQKEEEKKKKQEILDAKEEEKKKKEEEKRLKEEQKQKEEEEKQKQAEKRKAAFTSFFTKPKVVTSTKVDKAADNLFIPFEVKKDMTLAPVRRQVLSDDDKHLLDEALGKNEVTGVNYLTQLQQGDKKPVRTNRVLRKKVQAEDEVELLVHDSEAVKKSMHAVKLLQFHTDYRPPYYGTWQKKLAGLSPCNPWKKYEDVFDYEVDSDEEWEEEEPGESLSDSNGEEDEGEEEEEGEEDGWMVPHGYLSADEGCEDDEEVTPEVLKARQRAKAQAWEAELKAKREVIPPIHIGCYWLDAPCSNARQLDILKQFEMIFLRTSPVETLISKPETLDNGDKNADSSASKSTPGSKGCRKRALPEEAMPDLIRLVHGNPCGIKKLVREFRMYWRQKSSDLSASLNESKLEEEAEPQDKSLMETTLTETEAKNSGSKSSSAGAVSGTEGDKAKQEDSPSKTQNDSVANEDASDSCVSKRQLEMKIMAIAVREKREGIKKHCWYVNSDVLQQYNMADQPVENSWIYVSIDMSKKTPSKLAGESKTPNKSAAEKKTPNKPASNKKTSNKLAAEKKTPQKVAAQKLSQGPDEKTDSNALGTPNKVATESEGTPKAEKNKKEANGKKKLTDQPSIMAFAKKNSSKQTPGKTSQAPKAEHGSNTAEVIDVDIEEEAEATVESVTSEEAKRDAAEGKQPLKVDDCIVLD